MLSSSLLTDTQAPVYRSTLYCISRIPPTNKSTMIMYAHIRVLQFHDMSHATWRTRMRANMACKRRCTCLLAAYTIKSSCMGTINHIMNHTRVDTQDRKGKHTLRSKHFITAIIMCVSSLCSVLCCCCCSQPCALFYGNGLLHSACPCSFDAFLPSTTQLFNLDIIGYSFLA